MTSSPAIDRRALHKFAPKNGLASHPFLFPLQTQTVERALAALWLWLPRCSNDVPRELLATTLDELFVVAAGIGFPPEPHRPSTPRNNFTDANVLPRLALVDLLMHACPERHADVAQKLSLALAVSIGLAGFYKDNNSNHPAQPFFQNTTADAADPIAFIHTTAHIASIVLRHGIYLPNAAQCASVVLAGVKRVPVAQALQPNVVEVCSGGGTQLVFQYSTLTIQISKGGGGGCGTDKTSMGGECRRKQCSHDARGSSNAPTLVLRLRSFSTAVGLFTGTAAANAAAPTVARRSCSPCQSQTGLSIPEFFLFSLADSRAANRAAVRRLGGQMPRP